MVFPLQGRYSEWLGRHSTFWAFWTIVCFSCKSSTVSHHTWLNFSFWYCVGNEHRYTIYTCDCSILEVIAVINQNFIGSWSNLHLRYLDVFKRFLETFCIIIHQKFLQVCFMLFLVLPSSYSLFFPLRINKLV